MTYKEIAKKMIRDVLMSPWDEIGVADEEAYRAAEVFYIKGIVDFLEEIEKEESK